MGEPLIWQSACVSTVLAQLPEKVRKQIPEDVRYGLSSLVTPTEADRSSRAVIDGYRQKIGVLEGMVAGLQSENFRLNTEVKKARAAAKEVR